MPNDKLVPGASVVMGTGTFIIPALTLGQLKAHKSALEIVGTVTGNLNEAQQDAVLEVLHAAIGRNYPEVSKESLADMVDLRNLRPLIQALLGISGLLKDPADPPAVAGNH